MTFVNLEKKGPHSFNRWSELVGEELSGVMDRGKQRERKVGGIGAGTGSYGGWDLENTPAIENSRANYSEVSMEI